MWIAYYNFSLIQKYAPLTLQAVKVLRRGIENDLIDGLALMRAALDDFVDEEWRRRHGENLVSPQ